MISLKSFVSAIHDAIVSASESLMERNVSLLERYFTEASPIEDGDSSASETEHSALQPTTVVLEYPSADRDGTPCTAHVHVPLITLVPLQLSKIEKAVVSAEFDMHITDGQLEMSFPSKRHGSLFRRGNRGRSASLEITFTPEEESEGLRVIVEAYEATLKQQLP